MLAEFMTEISRPPNVAGGPTTGPVAHGFMPYVRAGGDDSPYGNPCIDYGAMPVDIWGDFPTIPGAAAVADWLADVAEAAGFASDVLGMICLFGLVVAPEVAVPCLAIMGGIGLAADAYTFAYDCFGGNGGCYCPGQELVASVASFWAGGAVEGVSGPVAGGAAGGVTDLLFIPMNTSCETIMANE